MRILHIMNIICFIPFPITIWQKISGNFLFQGEPSQVRSRSVFNRKYRFLVHLILNLTSSIRHLVLPSFISGTFPFFSVIIAFHMILRLVAVLFHFIYIHCVSLYFERLLSYDLKGMILNMFRELRPRFLFLLPYHFVTAEGTFSIVREM